jgi:hypothetical protein
MTRPPIKVINCTLEAEASGVLRDGISESSRSNKAGVGRERDKFYEEASKTGRIAAFLTT